MADPQPQSNDQGFLPGLLGKVRDFFPDPAAAYGGLLSDEATRRAFAWRELGAAAGAFSQGAMPVPYKGGIPFGATLGAAGAAASTAGDALMHARLEQAQADLAQQQGLLAHANVQGLAMNNSLYPVALGVDGKGGTGTGTDGKKLTGPAAIIARGGGGSASADPNVMKGVLNTAQQRQLTPAATTALVTVGLGEGGFDQPWAPSGIAGETSMGPWQFNSGSHLPAYLEKNKPGDVPAMTNYTIDAIEKDRAAKGLTPFASITDPAEAIGAVAAFENSALYRKDPAAAISSYSTHLPAATALIAQHSGASPQTASTGDQPAAAPGSQVGPYAPVPGQPGPQGVYVPPGASPNAPPVRIEGGSPVPVAPPGGSLKLPDPTSAAPPQLATPPAVTGLLGQQPAQQVAAADAPQLSPAAAAILQGINRQQAGGGLLASGSVAGGNAVPTGGPSPAAVAQAGPPHTGAAGAAELAGLLAQQPPPQAPAAGPVPPAAAPAPAPAPAGPMPPAPGGAPPPGVAPPMPPPAMPPMPPQPVAPVAAPGPIAGAPTDRQVAAASIIAHNNIMMGKAVPPDIAAILNYKYAGPTAAATAAATAPITQANAAYEARVKAQYENWVNQNKPREIRAGGVSVEPGTNRVIQNPAIVQTTNPTDGSEHSWYSYPSLTPGGIPTYQYIGMTKQGPGAVATATGLAGKNVEDFSTVQKEAAAAAQSLTQATFMRQEVPNFYSGPGAHETNFMNKALVSLGMGGDQAAKSAASYESFIKDGGALARAQAQVISQRVGVQELNAVAGTMPGEENTQRGLDRTLAQIQGVSDYRLQKQQAMTNYMGQNAGSNAGFEASFNKNISPYTYMYMRMSDQDRSDIRNQLSSTKAGQADLQRLQGQIKYITDNNLMPVQ